ncbi:MAG: membrane protein insertion efficiency factor YidD [Clostridia bacterium]
MKWICIGMLRLYKRYLSPLKSHSTCIFYPCCSVYSMEAYKSFGFFIGSFLTIKRLIKCAPWGKGGFDPIPYNFRGDLKWIL